MSEHSHHARHDHHDVGFSPFAMHTTGNNLTEFCMDFLKKNSTQLLEKTTQASPAPWQVWGIGLFSVAVISLSSVCGIIILPFLTPKLYNRTLTYFVALGVGTLSGSAVFHLIPEAFGLHAQTDYLQRAWMIIGGIYLFFVVDKLLNLVVLVRDRQKLRASVHPTAISKNNNGTPRSSQSSVTPSNDEMETGHDHDHIASVAWLVIFGDGLHNFIDGLSIGAAMNRSLLSGISIAVAVLCEELPHELGDCAILINSGMSVKKALFYNLASASTCFIGFVLGVLLGELDERVASFIFALAAGMFLYISLASMLSEMNKKTEMQMAKSWRSGGLTIALQVAGLATGLVLMFLFAEYGDLIHF